MQSVVLLMVGAVWLAVILPPMLRSRNQSRSTASMTEFRRQLSTLQRSVPTRTMVPARTMGRPLTQAQRYPQGPIGGAQRQATRSHGSVRGEMQRVSDERIVPEVRHQPHRQMHLHRVSQRELMRRRRINVLVLLLTTVLLSGFLAATTHAAAMVWFFGLSFIAASAYAYRLADLNRRSTVVDHTFGYDMPWLRHQQGAGQHGSHAGYQHGQHAAHQQSSFERY